MLSKCANPGCPAPFLYFHQGKLFRIEVEAAGSEGLDLDTRRARRRLEFYWLCNECAATLTLTFRKGVGVIATPVIPPVTQTQLAIQERSALVGTGP
jgi:hypothetical protein